MENFGRWSGTVGGVEYKLVESPKTDSPNPVQVEPYEDNGQTQQPADGSSSERNEDKGQAQQPADGANQSQENRPDEPTIGRLRNDQVSATEFYAEYNPLWPVNYGALFLFGVIVITSILHTMINKDKKS